MPQQPEITIKEIKLDNKVICKYHVDDSNILYIHVVNRNYSIREIGELEKDFQRIISIIEKRSFYGLAYLNI
jgi:hypothetical protein